MKNNNLPQSPFFIFMGFVGDVFLLNLCWLIGCLPIVTIGASTSAAFSVAGKMAAASKDDELDYRIIHDYLTAFRRDWAIATRVWLVLALLALVIAADYQIGTANSGSLGGALIALSAILGLVWVCAFGGAFALLGRFTYSKVIPLLKDGVLLCTANIKAALLWLVLVLALPLLRVFVEPLYYYLLPPCLLILGGAAITAFAYALRPAFAKIEKR